MIGLLRKDFYMLWAYCRMFLLMILIFIFAGALDSGGNSFYLIFPMIIGMTLSTSLVSYDERFRWSRACDAMPCSRAQVVSGKYIMTLLIVLVTLTLTLLAQGVRLAGQGRLEELRQIANLLLPIGLLAPALLLPVIFALGAERGRMAYFVLVGLVTASGTMYAMKGGSESVAAELPAPNAALLLIALLIYAASWLISIVLYRRREL